MDAKNRNAAGLFIKTRRGELGLSQNDVARSLGYQNAQYVSNIERGISAVPLARIPKLAQILGVEARHLLGLALMERIPEYREELLWVVGPMDGSSGMTDVPIVTTAQCHSWTEPGDVSFPRKLSIKAGMAATRDPAAFLLELRPPMIFKPASGIQRGDLLLVEPHQPLKHGALVVALLGDHTDANVRIGKAYPRDTEIIFLPLDTNETEMEVLRKNTRLLPVAEIRRLL